MLVRRTITFAVVILALALILVVPFASAAAGAARATSLTSKVCGKVSGPAWSVSGRSGTQYSVYEAKGAPCSLALTWAPKLLKQTPRGAHHLLTGPSGWGCVAQLSTLPHEGFCAQTSSGRVFGWLPKFR